MRSVSLGCPPPPAVTGSGCGMIGLDVLICCLFKVRFLGSRRWRGGARAALRASCWGCSACGTHPRLSEKGAAAIVFGPRTCLGCLPTFLSAPPGSTDPSRTLRSWVLADLCRTGIQLPEGLWRKILPPGRRERKIGVLWGPCLMLICWEALGPSFTF